MFIAATFDPSASVTGTFNTGLPVGGHFIIFNESPYGLNLTFNDKQASYVPAWSADIFTQPVQSPIVTWSQANTLNASSPPLSTVNVVSYYPSEKISGYFPIALARQQNVGNAIPLGGAVNSVANDSNTTNTTFVESTVSGDGISSVVLKNNGALQLGSNARQGSISIPNTGTIDNNGIHWNVGTLSVDNGGITTDGSGHLSGNGVSVSSVNAGTVNTGTLNTTTENVTGTITWNNASGPNANISRVNFTSGSISRVAKSTGSGTQTITHNWGTPATVVIPYYNGNFGTPPTQALAVDTEGNNSFRVVGQVGYSWSVFYLLS